VRTNIAVFQPDITGVRVSPIAALVFLKDLSRTRGGGLSEVAGRASQ
jgi:hypothetical protein